ncbi:hypothetical protein G6F35_016964 [Rhizopus arrhizus]|nr:hypothetical protein G6F35_016964 [Rhizopus arrhizus]
MDTSLTARPAPGSHPCRSSPPRIHRIDRLPDVLRLLDQHLLQRAAGAVATRHEIRQAYHAAIVQRQLPQRFAAEGAHARLDVQRLAIDIQQRPFVQRFQLRESQQRMRSQVRHALGRAARGQIRRARQDAHPACAQRHRMQRRILQPPDADGQVRAALQQRLR